MWAFSIDQTGLCYDLQSTSQNTASAILAETNSSSVKQLLTLRISFSSVHSHKGIIGSAEALPILCVRYFRWERERERERDTEKDGSDVTNVALKLAMNLHFPLPKIRTIGDELTLSLAKNSHFSFLPSHFPSLPSRRGHHCGAEISNEFPLSIAKKIPILICSSHRKNESN